ncbi:hypothetical protein P3T36_000357 [Kitasatospora sp. MAP12-15]|uniref:hypothetical protein n=1 Tax=unclassified Kitasatospora TaxID=2633591 RepID=UPI002476D30E|nr:hypothetical protein [Kitasatospora sp. MAP12-44]MDH6109586.1 hypothetical protein [Kitasatospora sp. MAP12-44]
MDPVFVDFSTPELRRGNAEARTEKCSADRDHLALGAGGAVEIDFDVPVDADALPEELTLKIRALVSKLGARLGYAPLEVTVNGAALLADHRIAGGGDLPHETVVAVPRALLRPGGNTLRLRSGDDARSQLWLYRVLLESVADRDGAERAWLADAAEESLLTYDTYRRAADGDSWEPGPPLRVYLDSGERGLPAQLGWRDVEGVEASVSFGTELFTFYGQLRDQDGDWFELRGDLTGRTAFPARSRSQEVLRFATEAGWGGRWHQGGPLTLILATGGAPLERINWSDQRGCSASIGLIDCGASFLGWSQRVNEGAVGYRGTVVAAPSEPGEPGTSPFPLADLEEIAATVGRIGENVAKQVSAWLRAL